jgi:hypothetical protein
VGTGAGGAAELAASRGAVRLVVLLAMVVLALAFLYFLVFVVDFS